MTSAEINFINNTSKPYRERIQCSQCDAFFTPKQMRLHAKDTHGVSSDAALWHLEDAAVSEDYDAFQVDFKVSFEKSSPGNTNSLDNIIQNFYEDLNDKYLGNAGKNKDSSFTTVENQIPSSQAFHYFIWEHVNFGKDSIKITNPTISLPPLQIPGIVPELNDIKQSFFSRRKELLKFKIVAGSVIKEESPGYQKILEVLDLAKASLKNFKTSPKNSFVFPSVDNMSNGQVLKAFKDHIKKSEYINILASLHDDRYKLIPIIENRNNHKEISFIFTLSGKDTVYAVWESCSEKRGTHIFSFSCKNYYTCIEKLKSYISNPAIFNKRKILWESNDVSVSVKKKLQHYKSLTHTTPPAFSNTFNTLK